MNSTTQTTPGAPKSRARKSVNAVAPSKENAFKAHQVEPSSSGEDKGPMYTRLYENHNGITAEQALESIEAETCMKILQSISALPEKMLLGSLAQSESRKSQHSEEGSKESKHKEKERDRDREQSSRKKEKEKPQKQSKSSRLASDSDSDSKETYEKKKKKHRDKEKPGREEKREREREREKEKEKPPSPESMVPIAQYPTVENASTVPESELFTKFGFVPLELTVTELEPGIIEGGMFYATLPFKKKPSKARSRSSSSDRSRSNSNSTDTRDSGKLSLNKKKSVVITESKCAVCTVALPDDTSAYCSEKCLVEIVNKATKAFASQDEGVSIVSSSGGLHSCKPSVAELLDFLKAYPIYVPLIPAKTAAKEKPVAKKPQEEPVKEKAPPKPLTKESDAIRFNVRQSLIKELTQSIRAIAGSCDLTKSRALIEQLEMILFKKCEMNVKSNKYKEFVKALIMCFREGKNEISIRLMNGSLTVQKLALIDPEMLKCDESLTPLRPAEVQVSGDTQDNVESVETPTTVAAAAEEPSTSKSQATAEATKQQTPLFTLKTSIPGLGYAVPKKKAPTRQQVSANALDSILGDGKRDTTSQHLSHFFDANCSICAMKMKSNAEAEKKDRNEKEKIKEEIKKKRQELKITERSLEFDSKRSSDHRFNDRDDDYDDDYASPPGGNSPGDRWNEADEDRDRDRDWNARSGRGSLRKDDSANRSGGDSWRRSENWRYNEDEDEDYRRGDRDFDRRRREEEREERDERRPGTSRDERTEVHRRGDAEGVKITKQQLQHLFMNPIIWRGQVVFNGVVFVSSLVALSGSSCFELTGQLPVSLKITGRIAPIVVFDYFSSIRLNKMYSIALYQIEQPMDDEGSRRFINLYMDMINKDRNFVIEVPCPLVREAYLLPLQPGQDPPAYLLPFDGPGILMSHGYMILCIMTLDTEPQGLDEVLPKAKAAVDGRISQLSNSSPRTDAASHGSADAIPPHSGSLPAPVPAPILAASAPTTTSTVTLDSSHDSDDVVPLNESEPAPVPAPALKDISSASNAPEQQQSDELFPANFFDRIREKGQQQDESGTAATDSTSAVVPMDPNSVRTLEDLLLYIELTESPKLIKDVVARFMADDSIPEEQKELIRTRVVNKITAAKNKRKMKDGEKSERRSRDDEQQIKEASVSAENDFQPTDECSTFADKTLHSVIDSARSKLNGSNEVVIDAARGDSAHSREIVPVSSMSMVGEAGSIRGPHTPEFDRSEKYTMPPSSSAGDVSHPSAETSFPPLPTIPPPPSKRTLPSALGPFGMPPPMTSMASSLFNTSAPPPLYPSHPGPPLYNAPLPQFPPQPHFNQPISATPFVTAHIDSTSNRGSIIDFFNSAGGFKPTTEIAPIPPELIHNKSIFSGGIAPGFGRARSESRSPSPNSKLGSPRSPQIGPGPSLSSERRPTIRLSTIAGRRILPGARAVRPPRPPRTPSPDPYELVRKQVIEERDRRRAQEADEKEERRRRLEEERKEYKERKRKREEEMLESLPGPVKVQRGLWDERMDELSQQAAEKSRAVNAEVRGDEMSSRLSDDEDPNTRKKNREGRGSREWKKPMVAQGKDPWQEESPWKKKKIRGKKKRKPVDGAAGGQEQTEAEQGEGNEGDETNTASETMDAQTVVEKTPQEVANKGNEANRFDDFDDSDIGMSFEKQPEKEQQQEESQENPFWDVEMPVLEFGSTKHRDVPPQRREKQPPPPKNRGRGRGQQQQQRHGAEPWKKNKQNMKGGRMGGNYLSYDNGYDDGGYDESYDDWAGGNAEPYPNQAYQAPDTWKRNRPNMRGKIFEGVRMGGPPPFDSRNRGMRMDRGRGGRGRRGFEDEPNWGNDSFNDGGFRQRGKKRGRNSFEEPGRRQDDYDDWANNDSWNEESSYTNPRSPFSNFAWSEYERDEPSQSADNWQNQRGGRGRFDRGGGGNIPRQVGPGPSPGRMPPPSQMHIQEGPLIPAPRGKPMPLFAVTPGPDRGRKPSPFFGGTPRPHSPVSFVPEAGHHPHTAPVLAPSRPVPKPNFPPGFPPPLGFPSFHPSRRMSPPSCVRSPAPPTLQPPPKAPRIGTPSANDSDLPPPPPPPPPPMDFDVVPVPPPPPIFNPPAPSS